jgi:parvulin-like peptidyl-prolyl isomerase
MFSGIPPQAEENNKQIADLTLRYVNDSVISFGDVLRRNTMRLSDYERRGRPLPATLTEIIGFAEQSLSELTEEELLIQYGYALSEQRGFRLVDHERISQMVMERSRESGRGNSLHQQAEHRKYLTRQHIIELVTSYFESRVPHITPEIMQRNFQERQMYFRRPARAKVLHIILRPSTMSERQEVKKDRLALFRRAQDVVDPAIRQASESRIEAYTIATADDQDRILGDAVQEIAKQAVRSELDAVSADLAQQATKIEERAKGLRDMAMTMAALEALRKELVGQDVEAFKSIAQKYSQGPNAVDGGDMGWIESGTKLPEFDQVAFETAKVGEVSDVFQAENNAYLLLVSERIEARNRSFAEVVGEIETSLRNDQTQAARSAAVSMLREKASIRDIITLATLLKK